MNEKIENQLNVALELPSDEREKSEELMVGYEKETKIWELIIQYDRLEEAQNIRDIEIRVLSNGYAIVFIPENQIERLASLPGIIYIEKPKRLEFAVLNGKRVSCINPLQEDNSLGLFGEGVIVGVIDSGIDYTHPAFRNQDGTTRILKLWDQVTNSVYDENDINNALESENPFAVVPSRDITGHGTHVAGIAAGNFAENRENNLGIATKSRLLIVKMATASDNSFPRTSRLMEAVDFVVKQARAYGMPLSLNISFGNSYGSHDGTSLISSYLDSVINENRISVQIGTGNEGDSAGHTSGILEEGQRKNIEFQVSEFQSSFSIQLWKNFADIYQLRIISPSGKETDLLGESTRVRQFTIDKTNVAVLYGSPVPYSKFQEVYMEFIPNNRYVDAGIWTIQIIPRTVVVGNYDLWLPGAGALNENTKFLEPDPFTTLTVPATTLKAIAVGAYDDSTDAVATFSGRGFLRESNQVKPDLVAPGVDIISAAPGGGLAAMTGTSMATPFVTGSAALMMEWGIVRKNDAFLYGEKVKAYLIRGARRLPRLTNEPSPSAGWGALCLKDSLNL